MAHLEALIENPRCLNGRSCSTAEEELSESEARQELAEARFRATFENAAVGIAHVAPDGTWLRVNSRLCEILGYPPRELLQKTFQDITHPGDLDADLAQIRRMFSGEIDSYSMDKRYLRKDGSIVWARLTVGAARGADGAIGYFISVVEDISEKKRAEQELRENEERFRTLADNISQFAWTADASGLIDWYNKRWYEFTGTNFEDMAGWGWMKVHHPDHVDRVVARVSEAFGTGEEWEDTFPLRGKDGQYRWFLSRALPIRNAKGEVVRWFGTNTDVTELREAQLAAQRLAAIVESSEDAIVAKDLHGIITSWNKGAERLFGYTGDEVIGKPVTILIPPERQDEEPAILARIRRGEHIDHYETLRRRKDGTLVEISLTVSPIKSTSGLIIGASKIARDITERKRAEAQKDLLLREMNHRIKNLFTTASSIVALSARGASSPEELARSVEDRLAALGRAHELTLTRPSSEVPLGAQATTLHALIKTILLPFKQNERGGGASLAVTGPDLPIGAGSVTAFALLLHEFATNAAKYGALSVPSGRIDIACSEDSGRFALIWNEHGGSITGQGSDSEGFGSVLVKATVKHQLGGEMVREWTDNGLTIRLTFEQSRVAN